MSKGVAGRTSADRLGPTPPICRVRGEGGEVLILVSLGAQHLVVIYRHSIVQGYNLSHGTRDSKRFFFGVFLDEYIYGYIFLIFELPIKRMQDSYYSFLLSFLDMHLYFTS